MGTAARVSAAFRFVACGLIATTVWGCSSWQATPLTAPAPGTASPRSDELKIRKPDGKEVTLIDWTLEGDSLRGTHEEWVKHDRIRTHEVFALSQVRVEGSNLQGDSLRHALESAPVLSGECRVQLVNGTTLEVERAAVYGDSLRCVMSADASTHQPSRQVAFALKDVQTVEVRRHSSGKTAALILVGAVLVIGAVLGFSFAEDMANSN